MQLPQLAPGQLSPPSKFFREPLMKSLGLMSDFKANVPVDVAAAVLATIKAAGFDPCKLPEGMSRMGRTPAGVDRQITIEYRNLNRHHDRFLYRDDPLTVPGQGRVWALPESGVKYALKYKPADEPKENLTNKWLALHGRNPKLFRMVQYTLGKKLPLSAATGQVDDLMQEFFAALIRRDGLRKRILEGKEVTYTHVAAYAVNFARNQIRNNGTDPVQRQLYGARTEYERKHGHAVDERAPADTWRVVQRVEDDGTVSTDVVAREVGTDTEIDFSRVWPVVEQALYRKHPTDAESHLRVIKASAMGLSCSEIAQQEGVASSRISTILQEGRDAFQEAREWFDLDSDGYEPLAGF